jgi:predicted nicotinamide N-methyase
MPDPLFDFPTGTETLVFGSDSYVITHVTDAEGLFERLLSLPADDPAVKDEQIPYWAELWPSAIALGEFLSENTALTFGKNICEIGCGLGLPGIVAGKSASQVILSDYLPEPLWLAAHNWKQNHSKPCETRLLDWRTDTPAVPFDLVLASDVAYERRMFEPLLNALKRLIAPGGTVILSEPDRHFARDFFNGLESHGWNVRRETKKVDRNGIVYRVNIHVLN